MAEGFVRKAGWLAFSAGTIPESEVNPYAVKVMSEIVRYFTKSPEIGKRISR